MNKHETSNGCGIRGSSGSAAATGSRHCRQTPSAEFCNNLELRVRQPCSEADDCWPWASFWRSRVSGSRHAATAAGISTQNGPVEPKGGRALSGARGGNNSGISGLPDGRRFKLGTEIARIATYILPRPPAAPVRHYPVLARQQPA